jgi:branched-chain amino acid aminotransferase
MSPVEAVSGPIGPNRAVAAQSAPAQQAPAYAWLNGRVVPFDQCVIHARTQGAFWGANVFEGLRGYWREEDRQLSVFRLDDHLARLGRSMKSLHMPQAYTDVEIRQACLDLLAANDFRQDAHVCVVAYFGMGPNFETMSHTEDVGVHITATPAPRSRGYHHGVAASISSWRRISDDSMPPRIKAGANYHNSRLAHHEAVRNGFNTALLLNHRGNVSEAPGSCVVMIRDGALITPPGTSGVLEGITLATVAELAQEHLGVVVERREIDRTELYVADEVFLCGTLAEIQPVVSIDHLAVSDGVPGPLTRMLQQLYEAAVRAEPAYSKWSTPVPVPGSRLRPVPA